MKDESSQNFDLPALLRLNSFDIRMAARNNLSLRTGEFFGLLSKFIQNAPAIKESLNKFSALEGDENDIQMLEENKSLLEDIGCDKLVSPFSNIIRAGKRGHGDFAAECAKKILGDFDRIITGIISARKETGTEGASHASEPLHLVLKTLEQEEAVRKMRVLAVDDDPIIIETITSLLGEDYKVFGITNQAMLEKFLEQIVPELFLLDYKMPGRNGFELIPVIRSFPEHKDTPIIFLTSMGTVDHVSAAAALGACDFIVKPFQDNMLLEKIAKHIVRKKLF
jgi:CheY-like chemotaxis protein